MKRFAPLAALAAAALLGGCAVYPDGTPMYGNAYGGGYDAYDGYPAGVPVAPQANVYMGYSNYSGPGYYSGPGRPYGPGPGYHGYPDRGRQNNGNDANYGNRGNGGGSHGQPNGGPPQQQGGVGGPRGPGGMGGSNGARPGAGGPPPGPQQQAGNGGERGNGGASHRGAPDQRSDRITNH
jgi:hypothetical protein